MMNLDKQIRAGFIRKVYGILCLQLLITFGAVIAVQFIPGAETFVVSHPALLYAAFGISICSLCALICVPSLAR